ncbi:hypothetical protein WM40_05815 [Robbsia andropogonis]|uniref:Uncharacterized protein n=1 Tax=Robbsia andropogonis TaxID=28092 RepID=A0A0F5K3G5_9BURK|nr:hypothetical protein WM40_05815 [Robbsia andropogonis]
MRTLPHLGHGYLPAAWREVARAIVVRWSALTKSIAGDTVGSWQVRYRTCRGETRGASYSVRVFRRLFAPATGPRVATPQARLIPASQE